MTSRTTVISQYQDQKRTRRRRSLTPHPDLNSPVLPLGGAGQLWQVRALGRLTQEEPAEATSPSPRSIGNLGYLRRDNIMITASTAAVSAKYYRTSAPNRADGSNRLWRKRYRLAVGFWGEGGSHGPRAGRKLSP